VDNLFYHSMQSHRFKSLSPQDSDDKMQNNIFKRKTNTPQAPTNSRWKRSEEEMHSNPFRNKHGNTFRNERGAPRMNSRWKRDESEGDGNEPRKFGRGSNSFRSGRRDRFNRRPNNDSYNSFTRKPKPPPKRIFNLETTDFPPLGKVESPSSSSRPKMDFSKAAYTNQDVPGPKHVAQRPERMPRMKKNDEEERDPLEWDTDDENEARARDPDDMDDDEPDWPAKGGYID